MTITVKDESQLKGLLDDEEYDAFVKDLEEKHLKEDNMKGGLGGLFCGKGDAEVEKSVDADGKPTGQDKTVSATAVGETVQPKAGEKASKQDETKATKTGN